MKIIFDPDNILIGGALSKEERTKYLELCTLITSGNTSISESKYNDITQSILEFVRREAHAKAEEIDTDKKTEIHTKLDLIFTTTDNTDTNFIGRINIVCFQCILLFTYYCLDGLSETDAESKFLHIFGKSTYSIYKLFISIDYTNYSAMIDLFEKTDRKILLGFNELYYVFDTSNELGTKYKYTITLPPKSYRVLILVVDYLFIDELIMSMIDRVAYCGFTSTFTYADGYYLTPYEFTEHDIAHSFYTQDKCDYRARTYFPDIKSIYNFCKARVTNPKEFYRVKLIIFLLFHENDCKFFDFTSVDDLYESLITHKIKNLKDPKERFLDINDLGRSLPAGIRGNWSLIEDYLLQSATLYIEQLTEWKKTTGGRRKIKRSKKVKKNKYRKLRKITRKYKY
jgi:hypothetical protein